LIEAEPYRTFAAYLDLNHYRLWRLDPSIIFYLSHYFKVPPFDHISSTWAKRKINPLCYSNILFATMTSDIKYPTLNSADIGVTKDHFVFLMTHRVDGSKTNATVGYSNSLELFDAISLVNKGKDANKNTKPAAPYWSLEILMGPMTEEQAKDLSVLIPASKRGIKSKRINSYEICDKRGLPIYDKRVLLPNQEEYIMRVYGDVGEAVLREEGMVIEGTHGKHRRIIAVRVTKYSPIEY
jgi:hypothetical protein